MAVKPKMAVGLALLLSISGAHADLTETRTSYRRLNETEALMSAHEWGLTEPQWREYEAIMAGRRGVWSPGLDPITALGVHAQTQQERDYYAELYVQQEFERVEKELAFQRSVNAAWKRLYPTMPRIASYSRNTTATAVERYGIVVNANCVRCQKTLKAHLALLNKSNALKGIDIYLADSDNQDDRLRQWVAASGLSVALIKSGQVTINHGGEFAALETFPTVFAKESGGRWVRQ